MPVLVDTNILVRFLDKASRDHPACVEALRVAKSRVGGFALCAQVTIEFWSVATRPLDVNGLNLRPAEADSVLRDFETFLPVVAEPPDMASRWRRLALTHQVCGRAAHDARLAAFMEAHSIGKLLTLNAADFKRFPHVEVIAPQQLIADPK